MAVGLNENLTVPATADLRVIWRSTAELPALPVGGGGGELLQSEEPCWPVALEQASRRAGAGPARL